MARTTMMKISTLTAVALAFALLLPATTALAEPSLQGSTEVQIEVGSLTIETLEKPVALGYGKNSVLQSEALVVSVEVWQEDLDALPPSLQPVLYVGRQQVPILGARPSRMPGKIMLDGYAFEWSGLEAGSPVVLTVDHYGPENQPERFAGSQHPRFEPTDVVDKR